MLKDDLFTIKALEQTEEKYKATVVIDTAHPIFKGHFPGQPVLPGVCTVEILKALIAEIRQEKYRLAEAGTIKFLSLVDPTQNNEMMFDIDLADRDDHLQVSATATLIEGPVAFKLKGKFENATSTSV